MLIRIILLGLSLGLGACGGHSPRVEPAPRESQITLPDGVGRFVSTERTFETNSYWIEGPQSLVMIDTQFTPSQAQAAIDAAERATGKPVKAAIVLHANPDKFNGTNTFIAHGAKVLTSTQVIEHVPAVDALRRSWFYDRYKPDYPEELPRLESFGDATISIELEGLPLTLHVLGPGCSDAHVVVQYNDVLFVGDLVANGTHAWMELGHLPQWRERLLEILAREPRYVMPGRGAPGGTELIDAQQTYFDQVEAIVQAHQPSLPMQPAEILSIRQQIERAYPNLSYTVFLRTGVPAVYQSMLVPDSGTILEN